MRYIVLCLFILGSLATAQQPSAPAPAATQFCSGHVGPGCFAFRTSANEFLRMCEPISEKPSEMRQRCILYVVGITDGAYVQEMNQSKTRPYRIPDTVQFEQEYRVAVKFMNDHPEETHRPTPQLVIEAMTAAFPYQGDKP